MTSITSANAVVMITIPGIFPAPVQLKGFAADDVYDTDSIESAETAMGVDGILSAGFVFVPVNQSYALQADSPSIAFFDAWWAAQQQTRDIYRANGLIMLRAVGKKWTMSRGVLTNYKPLPDAKKLLQPQKFKITWESSFPSIV